MKRWLPILLIFIYLCSTTEFYQFLKIPILVEHYLEHKSKNPGLSFYAFLKLHYDHHVKDGDWETDQKLPFIDTGNYYTSLYTLYSKYNLKVEPLNSPERLSKIIVKDEKWMEGEFNFSIWQPPPFRA